MFSFSRKKSPTFLIRLFIHPHTALFRMQRQQLESKLQLMVDLMKNNPSAKIASKIEEIQAQIAALDSGKTVESSSRLMTPVKKNLLRKDIGTGKKERKGDEVGEKTTKTIVTKPQSSTVVSPTLFGSDNDDNDGNYREEDKGGVGKQSDSNLFNTEGSIRKSLGTPRRRTAIFTTSEMLASPVLKSTPKKINLDEKNGENLDNFGAFDLIQTNKDDNDDDDNDDDDEVDKEVSKRHMNTVPIGELLGTQVSNVDIDSEDTNNDQNVDKNGQKNNIFVQNSPIQTPVFNRRKSIARNRKSLMFTNPSSLDFDHEFDDQNKNDNFFQHIQDNDQDKKTIQANFLNEDLLSPETATTMRSPELTLSKARLNNPFDSDSDDDVIIIKKKPILDAPTIEKNTQNEKNTQSERNPKKKIDDTKKSTQTQNISSNKPHSSITPPLKHKPAKGLLDASSDSDDDVINYKNNTKNAQINPQNSQTPENDPRMTSSSTPSKTITSAVFESLLDEMNNIPGDPFKAQNRFALQSDSEDDSITKIPPKPTNTTSSSLESAQSVGQIAREILLGKGAVGTGGVGLKNNLNNSNHIGGNFSNTNSSSVLASGGTPIKKLNNSTKNALSSALDNSHNGNSEQAYLDMDNMIEALYQGRGYDGGNSDSKACIKPSMLYLQIILSIMINIPGLDVSYSLSNNPKLQGKAIAPGVSDGGSGNLVLGQDKIIEKVGNDKITLFNHFLPPFLRLKPLPHQVYSLFWLIAHERDHDYVLFRYRHTLSAFFKKILYKRRQNYPTPSSLLLATANDLLKFDGILPSEVPLLLNIEDVPHLPSVSGDMLCDDCGLGKTYQLIALSVSGLIARTGIIRAYEFARSTLRQIQKRYLVNAKKKFQIENENGNGGGILVQKFVSPHKMSIFEYNNDPYVINLCKILYEISLFLVEITDYSQKDTLGQLPQLSPHTQLFIYTSSLLPIISRNYIISSKSSFQSQHSLLTSSLLTTALTPTLLDSYSPSPSNPLEYPLLSAQKGSNTPKLRLESSCPLCHDNSQHKVGGLYGATLVVCVKSVMTQWDQEIKAIAGAHPFPATLLGSFLPDETKKEHKKYLDSFPNTSDGSEDIPFCNVFTYHANSRIQLFDAAWDYEMAAQDLSEKKPNIPLCSCSPRYSFVLTTYETLRSDFTRYLQREAEREEEKLNNDKRKIKKGKKYSDSSSCDDDDDDDYQIQLNELTLQDVTWGRIIFDESHKVKNTATQNYKAAFELTTCNDIWYDQCLRHTESISCPKKLTKNTTSSKNGKIEPQEGDIDDGDHLNPDNALTIRPGGRHCVSATPLHNSADDLYSVMALLRFRPYNKKSVWKALLTRNESHKGTDQKTGPLWALIQSCMIRRERTQKNNPVYTKLIQFLQTRQFESEKGQKGDKFGPNNDSDQSDDDISDLITGMGQIDLKNDENVQKFEKMKKNNSNSNRNSSIYDKELLPGDQILSKSQWNKSYTPSLFLSIPNGPYTPDKPLFIKHLVKLSPVETLLYDTVSEFTKACLQDGQDMSFDSDDPNKAEFEGRIDLDLFKSQNQKKKPITNDTNERPLGKGGKRTFSYASALQAVLLRQQIANSLFFLTPNFIPLAFTMLRYNLIKQASYSPDDKVEYDFLYGKHMSWKKPQGHESLTPEELAQKMLFSTHKFTKVDNIDEIDSDEDELYDPIEMKGLIKIGTENNSSSNGNGRLTFGQNATKKIIYSDSGDDDNDDNDDDDITASLTAAMSGLNIAKSTPPKPSPYTKSLSYYQNLVTKNGKQAQIFSKNQSYRSPTLLQFADMYRRLLSSHSIKSSLNTPHILRFQKEVGYIRPKNTPHNDSMVPSYGFSSKMAYLLYLLTYISLSQPGASVIIFSQYTRTLDAIATALYEHSGFFNSYLHQYTKFNTNQCNQCGKLSSIHSDSKSAPYDIIGPSPYQQTLTGCNQSGSTGGKPSQGDKGKDKGGKEELDLTYLDDISTRTIMHSMQMNGYVSYEDTDLCGDSLARLCDCSTCQFTSKKKKKFRNKIEDEDDEGTLLRPHEELYYESQLYTIPSIVKCHCCLGGEEKCQNDKNSANKHQENDNNTTQNQVHSALNRFKSFQTISRIDGRQNKEEQEVNKRVFRTPILANTIHQTQTAIEQYENTHQCFCSHSNSPNSTQNFPHNSSNSHQTPHLPQQPSPTSPTPSPLSTPLPLNLMLISLKSGSVGLNFVEANHVILFEPGWNPMDRFQAMCRCIRNFQTKTVFVHELCTVDTIEERVFSVRQSKRLLSQDIIESGAIGQASQLKMSLNELSGLLD